MNISISISIFICVCTYTYIYIYTCSYVYYAPAQKHMDSWDTLNKTPTPPPLCSLAQCLRHSSAPVLSSTLLSDLELWTHVAAAKPPTRRSRWQPHFVTPTLPWHVPSGAAVVGVCWDIGIPISFSHHVCGRLYRTVNAQKRTASKL